MYSLSFFQGCGWWLLAAIILGMPTHLRKRLYLPPLGQSFILVGISRMFDAFSIPNFHIARHIDVHSFMLFVSGLLIAEFHRKTAFSDHHNQTAFGVASIMGTFFFLALPRDFLHPAAHLILGFGTAGIGFTLFRAGKCIVAGSPLPSGILPAFAFLGMSLAGAYTSSYGASVPSLAALAEKVPLFSGDIIHVMFLFAAAICLHRWGNRLTDKSYSVGLEVTGSRIILAVLLLAFAGILLAGHLEVKSLIALETETSSQAQTLVDQVNARLSEDERLSLLVSRHPAVIWALSDSSDPHEAGSGPPAPGLRSSNELLQMCDDVIMQCARTVPNSIWFVVNVQGIVISASSTFRGRHISFRPYLQEALSGKTGLYFALGMLSGETGHYTAQPVRSRAGSIIGVVIIKRPMSTLADLFVPHQNAMLISPEGIVFLASRPEWVFKTLFPLPSDQRSALEQTRQFGTIATSTLFMSPPPVPGYIRVFDREMFCTQKMLNKEKWRILLMNGVEQIALSRHLPLGLTLSLIVLSLAFHVGKARIAEKAQQAVQFEQQFKSVFENAPDGILLIDANTHEILAANPFMHHALGIKDPGILKQLRYESICQDGAGDAFEFFTRIACGEMPTVERSFKYSADQTFYGELTGSSLKLRDQNVFLIFIRDLTSRRLLEKMRVESEERFKKLFAAAPYGFVLIRESDHTIAEINQTALKMIGRTYDEVIGKNCHRFICPAEQGKCPISDLHQNIDNSERLLLGPGGLRIPIIKQVIKLDLNGVPHLLENFIDIGQRKKMELALATAKDAAEVANLEKSRFIAHMSHEIRTPMNALLGLVDVLHAEAAIPRQKHYLDLIKSAGESLLALLNDILDFSKIGASRMELEESLFDLPAFFKTTLELLSGRAAAKKIELNVELDSRLPRLVTGDQFRLRQILLNLLNNAVKFTNQGSVRLTVDLMPAETPGIVMLSVEVCDTGIGIPSDQISRLFQSFSQVRFGGDGNQEGTGLGLVICRQLVHLMQGEITVQSEPGKGSKFRFTVKLRLPEGEADSPLPVSVPSIPAIPAIPTGTKGSILLADDNEVNRELLEMILEQQGWKVTPVGTGREIVEQSSAMDFDLILADIQMPEMTGLEAVRAIREREKSTGKHVRMFALTGWASSEYRDTCNEAGFDGYLPKPYTQEQLLAVVAGTPETAPSGSPAGVTIDLEHLMARVCGDVQTLIRMIEIFVAKYPAQIEALEKACKDSNLAEVSAKAHSLKGTIGTFASQKVFQAVCAVESAARAGNTDEIATAMNIFIPLSAEFITELKLLEEKIRKTA